MRHLKSGKKLNRTASHRNATMRALASALFEHKRIHTTEAKAKALRPYAEKLISRAKNAIKNEQSGKVPEGQNVDVHSRRIVYKEIKNKEVLQELFDSIAPVVIERDGGYTRIVKTGFRRGDAAKTAIIELVDWSSDQDAAFQKSSTPKKKKKEKVVEEETAPVAEETTEEVESTPETAKEEETAAVEEAVEETTTEETDSKEENAEESNEESTEETSEDTDEASEEVTDETVTDEESTEEVSEKTETEEDNKSSETEESKEEDSDDSEDEKKD